jgi:hypothetical protein
MPLPAGRPATTIAIDHRGHGSHQVRAVGSALVGEPKITAATRFVTARWARWPDPQFHISSPLFLGRPAVTNGPLPGTQQQRPRDEGRSRRPGRDIMHPMFVKLFIETDADDLSPRRTSGAARAGPGEPGRPWPSGPPPWPGAPAAALTDDPPAVVVRRFQMRCNPRSRWMATCRHQPRSGAADDGGRPAAGPEGAQP